MRYRRIVHFSERSRKRGYPGGVEKFAHYLSQAIGCDVVTPADAPVLNDPDCLYIADAHWRMKIPSDITVVAFMHGCAIERGYNVWTGWEQRKLRSAPNTHFVCNSLETKTLCRKYYDIDVPDTIYLAVDEDEYYPSTATSNNVVLTASAGKSHKGRRLAREVADLAPDLVVRNLDCPIGSEADWFRGANVFMHLSTHEGFAFSILEAMAANLPIVVTPHGIAYELAQQSIPGVYIVPETRMDDTEFVHEQLRRALAGPSETREWVKQHCSYALFRERWQAYISQIQTGAIQPRDVSRSESRLAPMGLQSALTLVGDIARAPGTRRTVRSWLPKRWLPR
jgi:hypothetical protein